MKNLKNKEIRASIDKQNRLKKFICDSSGEMIELFELKTEHPEIATEIDRAISRQRSLNTMIFRDWFNLKELN